MHYITICVTLITMPLVGCGAMPTSSGNAGKGDDIDGPALVTWPAQEIMVSANSSTEVSFRDVGRWSGMRQLTLEVRATGSVGGTLGVAVEHDGQPVLLEGEREANVGVTTRSPRTLATRPFCGGGALVLKLRHSNSYNLHLEISASARAATEAKGACEPRIERGFEIPAGETRSAPIPLGSTPERLTIVVNTAGQTAGGSWLPLPGIETRLELAGATPAEGSTGADGKSTLTRCEGATPLQLVITNPYNVLAKVTLDVAREASTECAGKPPSPEPSGGGHVSQLGACDGCDLDSQTCKGQMRAGLTPKYGLSCIDAPPPSDGEACGPGDDGHTFLHCVLPDGGCGGWRYCAAGRWAPCQPIPPDAADFFRSARGLGNPNALTCR